jgi:transposase
MRKLPKVSPEAVGHLVRVVFEAEDQHPSQWAAIESIAGEIGCTAERDQRLCKASTTAVRQQTVKLHVDVGGILHQHHGTDRRVRQALSRRPTRLGCV